jgi:transglutaminase-like putative cysteine protease/sugar lactone lactonase YvrE
MPGDVVWEWATPGQAPTGLAWDGEHLWLADRIDDTLTAIDPETGEAVRSLPAPGFVPLGLAWDGEAIWCLDAEQGLLHRLDPDSGLTVKTIPAPARSPSGLTWDGEYLWLSDDRADTISQISTEDGTTVATLDAPAGAPQGLAFDGRYLWCADRVADRIHMVDPEEGWVVVSLEAPGAYARGLTWVNGTLWNADYQDDRLYAIDPDRDGEPIRSGEVKRERLRLTHEFRNYGPGEITALDVYFALPSDLPNQRLLSAPTFSVPYADTVEDRWGQQFAHYHVDAAPLAERIRHTMTVDVALTEARWFLYPERVGSLDEVPAEIAERYLVDEDKYRIDDPVIQNAVAEAVGDETNPYRVLRKIHRWVGEQLEYELVGGWNVAPAVLERGTGSCSEYTFVFIAMCRAAGLPARYVGAVLLRGDDASTDEVYHRWPEVYLPGYGWLPADAQAGDNKSPAAAADTIGYLPARALITTIGGGRSEILGWSYNTAEQWIARGPVTTHVEAVGEWSPLAAPASAE